MNQAELVHQIFSKQSFLIVGLDISANSLPETLKDKPNAIVDFAKAIVAATEPFAVGYKINTAFFEARGSAGWTELEEIVSFLRASYGNSLFLIADAKRGDIGNTSNEYAKAFLDVMDFDDITVAPYMGSDSLKPFLQYSNKWVISLGLTSNQGANDFQLQELANGKLVFEEVIETTATWGTPENLMFVVGATRQENIALARKAAPNHFFLVPGIGAQGGSLEEVWKYASTNKVGLLVNASRSIIYASYSADFESAASKEAQKLQLEMAGYLQTLKA